MPILVETIAGSSISTKNEAQKTNYSNDLGKAMEDLSIRGQENEK